MPADKLYGVAMPNNCGNVSFNFAILNLPPVMVNPALPAILLFSESNTALPEILRLLLIVRLDVTLFELVSKTLSPVTATL